jgi:hypothetical protein
LGHLYDLVAFHRKTVTPTSGGTGAV